MFESDSSKEYPMHEEDKVVSLQAHRRKKQEREVMDHIGLTPAERTKAERFINPTEMDEFIFRSQQSKMPEDDTFPTHPWTGF